MNLNPVTASVEIKGVCFDRDSTLSELKILILDDSKIPFVVSAEWTAFNLVDPDAAVLALFKGQQLWQIRIALLIAGETPQNLSGNEIERQSIHEEWMMKNFGTLASILPSGGSISLNLDDKTNSSQIIIQHR